MSFKAAEPDVDRADGGGGFVADGEFVVASRDRSLLFEQVDASISVIPEGALPVNRLLTIGFAGFRPPCGQRSVRTGVKTERPQRSEDGLRLDAGPARCMLSGGCRKISGGFCGYGAFSKPSWRTDPASHDSSPRLVSERCLTARRLSRINLTCFHLHYASTRSKHWSLLRELTSGQLGTTNPPEHPKAPNGKSPEPNAGSELFRCPETSHDLGGSVWFHDIVGSCLAT